MLQECKGSRGTGEIEKRVDTSGFWLKNCIIMQFLEGILGETAL
jgi:hypothetical protein